MARTKSEIESEMATLKASGVHAASREMRDLRAEIAALSAPADDVGSSTPPDTSPGASPIAHTGDPTSTVSLAQTFAGPSPLDSDEWRFVQQVMAEIELPEGSSRLKKLYYAVSDRVKMWRRLRDLTMKMGPGAEWPDFPTFGISEDTGKPVAPKVAPTPPPAQTVRLPAPTSPVAPNEADAYKEAIRRSMMGPGMLSGPPPVPGA